MLVGHFSGCLFHRLCCLLVVGPVSCLHDALSSFSSCFLVVGGQSYQSIAGSHAKPFWAQHHVLQCSTSPSRHHRNSSSISRTDFEGAESPTAKMSTVTRTLRNLWKIGIKVCAVSTSPNVRIANLPLGLWPPNAGMMLSTQGDLLSVGRNWTPCLRIRLCLW